MAASVRPRSRRVSGTRARPSIYPTDHVDTGSDDPGYLDRRVDGSEDVPAVALDGVGPVHTRPLVVVVVGAAWPVSARAAMKASSRSAVS